MFLVQIEINILFSRNSPVLKTINWIAQQFRHETFQTTQNLTYCFSPLKTRDVRDINPLRKTENASPVGYHCRVLTRRLNAASDGAFVRQADPIGHRSMVTTNDDTGYRRMER